MSSSRSVHSSTGAQILVEESISWSDFLPGDEYQEVLAFLAECADHDGHRFVCECNLRELSREPQENLWAATVRDQGRPVAYAQLHVNHSRAQGELLVHPRQRRRQLGTHLLQRLLEQARSQRAARLDLWAQRESPAVEGLARRHRLQPLRAIDQMRRDCRGVTCSWPSDYRLRPFHPDRDTASWLALHQAVQTRPGATLSQDCLQMRLRQPWYEPNLFLLAYHQDHPETPAGYVWLKRTGTPVHGELFMLAVHPNHRGRGLGQQLAAHGIQLLLDLDVDHLLVYVDQANQAGHRLYQSLGFAVSRTDRCYTRHFD